jgi:hypothetical protein
MDADLPIDAGSAPRRRFTIRSMMLTVVAVAVLLGWGIGLVRSHRWVDSVTARLVGLLDVVGRDDPSLQVTPVSLASGTHYAFHALGARAKGRGYVITSARREISISLESRAGILGNGPDRVIFESGDRTESWPYEDVERGRKVDLRAMFPEAFR